jgi:hypothetical protein
MNVKSYNLETTGADPINPATLLTGASGGTVVRSLEICNNSGEAANVKIQRRLIGTITYGLIEMQLEAGDYVTLFVGAQTVLPKDHVLQVGSDQDGVQFVANVIEFTEAAP